MFKESYKGKIKEKYHFSNKLASGGFGIVYLAEDRQTQKKYAIKAIQKKRVKDFNTFVNEVNILQALVSCSHPNSCRTTPTSSSCTKSGSGRRCASWCLSKSSSIDNPRRYCEGGELFHYIIEKKYLTEDVAAFIMH